MPLFFFNVCRDGVWTEDRVGGDYPDCGMAFRAARDMIHRLRTEENLPADKLPGTRLQVTYADRSELFDLPFDLGI